MASVLLVEDDRSLRLTLRRALESRGHSVAEAAGVSTAKPHFSLGTLDLVLTDVGLPDGSGLDLLEYCRALADPPAVIVISGREDLGLTIAAIRGGASECLFKPLDLHELTVAIATAIEQRDAARRVRQRGPTQGTAEPAGLVGRSAAMRAVAKRIAHAANLDEPVLLFGESGTGKEVVARTIHCSSTRAARPFVAVNCAALSATLVEAELFGASRGAFTGAVVDRPGRFESAADGTLFLDEIGELALELQPKLLRVLQERTYERVGDTRIQRLEARVIAATNRDLAAEVKAGRFRADLYYRLNVLAIGLPPLRDRLEDLELLVARLLAAIAGPNRASHELDAAAIARLREHSWPGNVRELGNVLRRAVAMSPVGVINSATLDAAIDDTPAVERRGASTRPTDPTLPLLVVERQHIERVLESSGWNKRQACRLLGISRPTLDRKLREFGLRRPGELEPTVDDDSAQPGVPTEEIGDETPLPEDADDTSAITVLPSRPR